MAQKIVVMNYKGGVGKTVVTVNLAATLSSSRDRNRVLLVDLDPQGNASSYCYKAKYDRTGDEEEDDGKHVGAFLNGEVSSLLDVALEYSYPQEIKKDPEDDRTPITKSMVFDEKQGKDVEKIYRWNAVPNFKIVPAYEDLGLELDIDTFNANLDIRVLKNCLDELEKDFDYIFLDCPPSFNKLSQIALLAADHALIPVKPGPFEFAGLIAMLKKIASFEREYGHVLNKNVVMNMIRMGAPRHITFYKMFKDQLGDVMLNQSIPLAEEITHSIGMNLPLAYSKKGNLKLEFEKLSRELVQIYDRLQEATHA